MRDIPEQGSLPAYCIEAVHSVQCSRSYRMESAQLCLCLTGRTLDQNLKTLEKNRNFIDMAELRADFLDPDERSHLNRFPALAGIPLILTVRKDADGGQFRESESIRREILSRGIQGNYRFVDLEGDLDDISLEETIRQRGARIIRSIHAFDGIESLAAQKIERLRRKPDDIPKLAALIKSTAELNQLIQMQDRLPEGDRILIGMGSYGTVTRILAGRLGLFLSYTSTAGAEAAPGQIDPETLDGIYRFHRIGPNTAVYGVIGNPVAHSFSPGIHNPAFSRLGINAVYIPIQVDRIDDFFPLAERLGIKGISVTIPHKQTVLAHLRSRNAAVDATGACNTLVRSDSGWHGENTDVGGFLAPLAPHIKELSGKRATVIGAGGAARSVVYSLRKEGCSVLILNRTPSKARDLALAFDCRWGPLNTKGVSQAASFNDLIVQTTSAGMALHSEEDPFPDYCFTGQEIVYEIVYTPPVTPFLSRAIAAGCHTIKGIDMLIAQADLQFRLFTGQPLQQDRNPGTGNDL